MEGYGFQWWVYACSQMPNNCHELNRPGNFWKIRQTVYYAAPTLLGRFFNLHHVGHHQFGFFYYQGRKMSKNKQISESEQAELLALYQVTTQDLAFFKSQQWSLTNYALVALATITGVQQLPSADVTPCVATLLCLAAIFLTVLTGLLLLRLHGSIEERRARLERIYARLSEEFRSARGIKKSVGAWEMILPLFTLLAFALALTIWLVVSRV